MIYDLLAEDGVYMIEMIDVYKHGLFLGSMLRTLQDTFPYVYAVSEKGFRNTRNTYVLIAAKQEIDVETIIAESRGADDVWINNQEEIKGLKAKAGTLELTDDYAPVENLLAPVVKDSAAEIAADNYLNRAEHLSQEGNLEDSIKWYRKAAESEALKGVIAYNEIALMQVNMGQPYEAVESFKKAIEYNENTEQPSNIPNLYYNLGTLLTRLKRSDEAVKYFEAAIIGFKKEIALEPENLNNFVMLGDCYASTGNYAQAAKYLNDAVNKNPYEPMLHYKLARVRELNGDIINAIKGLQKAIGFLDLQKIDAAELKEYLARLQNE